MSVKTGTNIEKPRHFHLTITQVHAHTHTVHILKLHVTKPVCNSYILVYELLQSARRRTLTLSLFLSRILLQVQCQQERIGPRSGWQEGQLCTQIPQPAGEATTCYTLGVAL
jgi:hypothetical protein